MVLEKNIPVTDKRNYGIDLLRIMAMFMVVLLHVLGPGGILFEAKGGSANFAVAWLFEMAIFCAINCYGIISGYVGAESKYKYSNLFIIWLQVIFFSVGITLFHHLRYPTVITTDTLFESFFPVSNGYYWYFTAYVGMFLLIPVLNSAYENLRKNQFKAVLISLFVALCVLPSIFNKDIFLSGWGYSTMWLAFLYLTGAYIKKYGFFGNKNWVSVVIYLGCVLLSWGVKMLEEYLAPSPYWSDLAGGFLTQYSSPTMFLTGVSLFVIFANISLPKAARKIVAFIAPCTFGVYIIHAHPLMWDRLITYKYAHFIDYNPILMILAAVGSAIILFCVLWSVDFVRHCIFRLFRIKNLLQRCENKLIKGLWNKEG